MSVPPLRLDALQKRLHRVWLFRLCQASQNEPTS